MPQEEIAALETQHQAEPAQRPAQRALARLMTENVHGLTEREKAEQAAAALFGKGKPLADMDEKTLLELVKEAPSSTLAKTRLEGAGCPIVELLVEAPKLWPSKGEAKNSIQAGGANLNNVRLTDFQRSVTGADLLHGKYLVLRKGQERLPPAARGVTASRSCATRFDCRHVKLALCSTSTQKKVPNHLTCMWTRATALLNYGWIHRACRGPRA